MTKSERQSTTVFVSLVEEESKIAPAPKANKKFVRKLSVGLGVLFVVAATVCFALVQTSNSTKEVTTVGAAVASSNPLLLAAFGSNNFGHLGDGTQADQIAAVPITTEAGVFIDQIASGFGHIAFISNRKLYQAGTTYYGDGSATTTTSLTPVVSTAFTDIQATSICAGASFTILVRDTGAVYVWGNNVYGELGVGTRTNVLTPTIVPSSAFGGAAISKVACGGDHAAFLSKSTGKVWLSGFGGNGRLGTGDNSLQTSPVQAAGLSGITVTDVCLGDAFGVLLTSTGKVYSFGSNGDGSLGDGTNTDRATPTQVLTSAPSAITPSTVIDTIHCRGYHVLAKSSTGQLFSWGYNLAGNLCDGTTVGKNYPVKVDTSGVLSGVTIVKLATTNDNSFFVSQSGELYGCGSGPRLGIGSTSGNQLVPVRVNAGVLNGKKVRDVVARYSSTHVLYENPASA